MKLTIMLALVLSLLTVAATVDRPYLDKIDEWETDKAVAIQPFIVEIKKPPIDIEDISKVMMFLMPVSKYQAGVAGYYFRENGSPTAWWYNREAGDYIRIPVTESTCMRCHNKDTT